MGLTNNNSKAYLYKLVPVLLKGRLKNHLHAPFKVNFSKNEHTNIRIAVSLFFFCQGISFASWACRIPDIKSTLHLSDAALGSILLLLPAGQLTAMPVSGKLITRYGSHRILRVAILLYVLALVNIGLCSKPWQLALSLYLFGIVGNFCNISGNTQALLTEKMYSRPIMTSFHGVWSIAGFIGALVGILMTSNAVAPVWHFTIIATLVFSIVAIAQTNLNKNIPVHKAVTEKRPFFSRPDTIIVQLGIIGFCCMATEGAMFEWSGVYFKEIVKAPEALVILGYTSFMIMMAMGRFLGDKVIWILGAKKTLQLSGLVIFSGLMISVLFPHIITATLGFIIVGLGVSSVIPTVYSSVGRVSKLPPGIALASVSSISYLGFLIGPPVIGFISEMANLRFSLAFIALLGLMITGIISRINLQNHK